MISNWWASAEAIIFDNKIIGFVSESQKDEYTVIAGIPRNVENDGGWDGIFYDKQEAINYLTKQYVKFKLETINVVKANSLTLEELYIPTINKVLDILQSTNIIVESIYVRGGNTNYYNVLITMGEIDHLNNLPLGFYDTIQEIEDEKGNIYFTITSCNKRLKDDFADMALLTADGYVNLYNKFFNSKGERL